jgi:hypothetical protein
VELLGVADPMSLRSFLHIGETDCVAGVIGLEL